MAVPKAPLALDSLVARGDASAKLVVVMYEDSQCPACGRFWTDVMPALEARYVKPGMVRVMLSSVPLPMHPAAWPAAQSVACANRQGKGWEMQDLLFRKQQTLEKALDPQNHREYGESLGFDVARFEECLPVEGKADVARQLSTATGLGLNATPTFVIGRMRPDGKLGATDVLQGMHSIEKFAKILDRLSRPWYLSPVVMGGAIASVLVALTGMVWIHRRRRRVPSLA
jgi:protein-disulfide isomerase